LIAEQRHEGLALVDESRELSDIRLPDEGTDGHAALILAGHLAERLRAGETAVPLARCEAVLAEAAQRNARRWRRAASTAEGGRALCHELLARLEALGLLTRAGELVHPHAVIARYGLRAEDEAASQAEEKPEDGQTSLF